MKRTKKQTRADKISASKARKNSKRKLKLKNPKPKVTVKPDEVVVSNRPKIEATNDSIKTVDGIVVMHQDLGLYSGLIATMTTPVKNPQLGWSGTKISLRQWKIIISFLRWTYQKFNSESQMRLYYNDRTHKWKPIVLPQEVDTGMTSTEIEGHDARGAILDTVPHDKGWRPAGTIHHHCNISAFQSGTDYADEIAQNGLHLTLGFVGSKCLKLHGRASFRKIMYTIDIPQWLDVKEADIGKPYEVKFPQVWKDCCIPKPEPQWKQNQRLYKARSGGHSGRVGYQYGLSYVATGRNKPARLTGGHSSTYIQPTKNLGSTTYYDFREPKTTLDRDNLLKIMGLMDVADAVVPKGAEMTADDTVDMLSDVQEIREKAAEIVEKYGLNSLKIRDFIGVLDNPAVIHLLTQTWRWQTAIKSYDEGYRMGEDGKVYNLRPPMETEDTNPDLPPDDMEGILDSDDTEGVCDNDSYRANAGLPSKMNTKILVGPNIIDPNREAYEAWCESQGVTPTGVHEL